MTKSKRGRKKLNGVELRNDRITLTLSTSEKQLLESFATELGISKSMLIGKSVRKYYNLYQEYKSKSNQTEIEFIDKSE